MRLKGSTLDNLVYLEVQANYHGLTEDELAEIIAQKGRSVLRRLFQEGRLKREGAGVKRAIHIAITLSILKGAALIMPIGLK